MLRVGAFAITILIALLTRMVVAPPQTSGGLASQASFSFLR
jgi:hypothetical protein